MEVTTGSAVPAPSGLENILAILALAADHHDPATETKHDLDALANQAAAMSPQANTLGKLLAAVFQYGPAVLSLIEALKPHGKPTELSTPPTAEIAPGPSITTPIAPAPVAPAVAPVGKLPDAVGLDVDRVFGPDRTNRNERTFIVDDQPVDGHYQMVMADGTDSIDDQSGLIMSGILMLGGRSVFVEEVPGATSKVYWKVTNVDTGETNVLRFSSPGVGEASKNEHATNWRVEEFVRTRGFNPVLHLHDKASGYDITFGVDGVAEAVPIRTPSVR